MIVADQNVDELGVAPELYGFEQGGLVGGHGPGNVGRQHPRHVFFIKNGACLEGPNDLPLVMIRIEQRTDHIATAAAHSLGKSNGSVSWISPGLEERAHQFRAAQLSRSRLDWEPLFLIEQVDVKRYITEFLA